MNDFAPLKDAMAATARLVDKKLDQLLPTSDGGEKRVIEAMRYSLLSGGKRLRPFLVVAGADLFGVSRESALRVAVAVECIHCYSLIHDDLPAMDDDDMRRGQPSCHKKFGEATAILAGDGLLTFAFEVLADEATHPDPHVRCSLITALARASGHHGMVGGQMIDLDAEDRELTEHEVTRLQQMKTGALIIFAAEAGAILGKASQQKHHALVGYGRALGQAFQIADDLLDVEGDEEEVGKATGKDADAGKATLVSLLGLERARQQAELLSEQAVTHLKEFGESGSLLRATALFVINRKN